MKYFKIFNKFIKNPLVAVCMAAILLQTIFLIAGFKDSTLGFPLDDAWIHQTYARNLVTNGTWSFIPGVISGGSTSPFWTLILCPGFFFGGNFFFYWTITVSELFFLALIALTCISFRTIVKGNSEWSILFLGLLLAMEWHLQWAAASGMETIAFCCIIMAITASMIKQKVNWLTLGVLMGLVIWVRPDGLTLLGPLLFFVIERIREKSFRWREAGELFVPFVLLVIGYFGFNYLTTGQMMPNTFFAKQMEYKELLSTPLIERVWVEFSPIWVGCCIFLLPGFIYTLLNAIKKMGMLFLGLILWVLGYVCLFAIRLPVIYQHGRYVMPVIPIFLLLGFIGTVNILELIKNSKRKQLVGFTVFGILLSVSLAFFLKGIRAFQSDIAVIDSFMVQPALWVKENTPNDAVIAVHDIGAMGFYSDRSLIDLAGLANPEVIEFIRDEVRIEKYMSDQGADYFIGFNDWYENSGKWGDIAVSFSMVVEDKTVQVDILRLNY